VCVCVCVCMRMHAHTHTHTHPTSVTRALGESCVALCEDHAKAEDVVKSWPCSLSGTT
jgi:hypothetical protein